MSRGDVRVVLEVGRRRSFASALDWPGWSRSGKGEEGAVEALLAGAERYCEVLSRAGLPTPSQSVEIVEVKQGNATTDFGAPGVVSDLEHEAVTTGELAGQLAALRACWAELDRADAAASPVLAKGPRGGGRDRDAVVAHVLSSEAAYARGVGLRATEPDAADPGAVAQARQLLVHRLEALAGPDPDPTKWPVRYAVRRVAWHVLDHAWEIQDRSLTPR